MNFDILTNTEGFFLYTSAEIAERIKATAKQQGKTAKEILENASLTRITLFNMKSSYPQVNNLTKIADELGCSLDYLMGRTENPNINR